MLLSEMDTSVFDKAGKNDSIETVDEERITGYCVPSQLDNHEGNPKMAEMKPIKKGDPPPMKRKRGPRGSKYDAVVEKLKETPGEWWLVSQDVTTTTARLFKEKGCEATTRVNDATNKPNRVDVWAMWPGEKPKPKRKPKPKT